jgi:hypothetical protein
MQVIFGTVPVPFPARLANGDTADGVLQFQVQVYAPGEEDSVWPTGHVPHTASEWLSQVNSQDKIVVAPPATRLPTTPPIEVPAAVLRTLPGDVLVVMEWAWMRVTK